MTPRSADSAWGNKLRASMADTSSQHVLEAEERGESVAREGTSQGGSSDRVGAGPPPESRPPELSIGPAPAIAPPRGKLSTGKSAREKWCNARAARG